MSTARAKDESQKNKADKDQAEKRNEKSVKEDPHDSSALSAKRPNHQDQAGQSGVEIKTPSYSQLIATKKDSIPVTQDGVSETENADGILVGKKGNRSERVPPIAAKKLQDLKEPSPTLQKIRISAVNEDQDITQNGLNISVTRSFQTVDEGEAAENDQKDPESKAISDDKGEKREEKAIKTSENTKKDQINKVYRPQKEPKAVHKEQKQEAIETVEDNNTLNLGDMSHSDDDVLILTPANSAPLKKPLLFKVLNYGGILATGLWVGYSVVYLIQQFMSGSFDVIAPHQFGGIIAGLLAPIVLYWAFVSYIQRGSDIHRYSDALRSELQSILFPSEEGAERANRDIERLSQQAAELAASSKAVTKTIARARQGLRNELKEFAMMSGKTEKQIDRLSEILRNKTNSLLDLTGDIDSRTSQIGERAAKGLDAWENATKEMLARSEDVEKSMGAGTERILEAAATANEKAQGIEASLDNSLMAMTETVTSLAKKLETLNTQFDDQSDNLNSAVDKISTKTDDFASTVQEQIGKLDHVASHTLESMSQSSAMILKHQTALDESSERLSNRASKISQTIQHNVDKLNDSADYITEQTDLIDERIDAQAERLKATVQIIIDDTEQIDAAAESAANRMNEALRVILSGTESLSASVRRSVKSLEDAATNASDRADDIVSASAEKLQGVQDYTRVNLEELQNLLKQLDVSKQSAQTMSDNTRETLELLTTNLTDQTGELNKRVNELTSGVSDIQELLTEPLRDLEATISVVDRKHIEIEGTLEKRTLDLTKASDKAKQTADYIRDNLRDQAHELSNLSGQIAGHTRSVSEELSKQKLQIESQVRLSVEALEDVQGALSFEAQNLSEISANAIVDLDNAKQNFKQYIDELGTESESTMNMLNKLSASVAENSESLREISDHSTNAIQVVRDDLILTTEKFEPIFSSAMQLASDAQIQFKDMQDDFELSSKSKLSQLKEIGIVFEDRLKEIEQGSDSATNILKDASENLSDRVKDIEDAASTATSRIRDVQDSLSEKTSDMHLAADQSILQVQKVQSELDDQVHDLSKSVGHAVSQIADVVRELEKSSNHVHKTVEDAVEQYDKAGSKARDESDNLNIAASKTVTLTDELVDKLKSLSEDLANTTKDNLSSLQKTGDVISVRIQEVSSQMKTALDISKDYSDKLREQSNVVAEASSENAEQIDKALGALAGKLDDIQDISSGVLVDISKAKDQLAEESERLISVSSAALKTSDEVSQGFKRQTELLFKTIEETVSNVDRLHKMEWQNRREAFMSSAKFVIESLHSLSVDFTRMIDGEVPERTWKAFQRGDVSAFTKRLTALKEDLPMEKIQDKFANDNEFRTYVQRYLRQFEEVFEKASETDHADLLGATFASSEVGRLYEILCTVAGRPSKLKIEALDKRAA